MLMMARPFLLNINNDGVYKCYTCVLEGHSLTMVISPIDHVPTTQSLLNKSSIWWQMG